jgi:hypothetical protein
MSSEHIASPGVDRVRRRTVAVKQLNQIRVAMRLATGAAGTHGAGWTSAVSSKWTFNSLRFVHCPRRYEWVTSRRTNPNRDPAAQARCD